MHRLENQDLVESILAERNASGWEALHFARGWEEKKLRVESSERDPGVVSSFHLWIWPRPGAAGLLPPSPLYFFVVRNQVPVHVFQH